MLNFARLWQVWLTDLPDLAYDDADITLDRDTFREALEQAYRVGKLSTLSPSDN